MATELKPLHDSDFYGWTLDQAGKLRQASRSQLGTLSGLDLDSLADELEELGMSKLDELFSRYKVLVWHLLKWQYQPDKRSKSWRNTIVEQRRRIARVMRRNPSVRPKRLEELDDSYTLARNQAAEKTNLPLSTFPETCPFTLEQVEDPDFWPGSGDAGQRISQNEPGK